MLQAKSKYIVISTSDETLCLYHTDKNKRTGCERQNSHSTKYYARALYPMSVAVFMRLHSTFICVYILHVLSNLVAFDA